MSSLPTTLESMRKRAPFKFSTGEPEHDPHVLDEEEQESLIADLRASSSSINSTAIIALQGLVGLSTLLQCIHFLSPSTHPLLPFFPSDVEEPPLPLSVPLILLAIALHMNLFLALQANPNNTQKVLPRSTPPAIQHAVEAISQLHAPLASGPAFALSAASPLLALLHARSWPTVAWWGEPAVLMVLVHGVLDIMETGDGAINELDELKYVAPGV